MCSLKTSWALQPVPLATGISLALSPDFLRSPCPLDRHLHHLFPVPSSQGEHPPLPATQGQDSRLVF